MGAYEKVGSRNPAWDKDARFALQEAARFLTAGGRSEDFSTDTIARHCRLAIAAGCDDPLVAYFHARVDPATRLNDPNVLGETFRNCAEGMQSRRYHSFRQFYAWLRAGEHLKAGADKRMPREVSLYRNAAFQQLLNALQDPAIPLDEACNAVTDLMWAVQYNQGQREGMYPVLEGLLFKHWPHRVEPLLVKARYYIDRAWAARGSDYSDAVTAEGWKLFEERLAIAAETLEKAWKLDPTDARSANEMLSVELGQGQGRKRLEMWFDRAMTLATNNHQACSRKLRYLEPKWHGSREDMIAFGWQCVQSTNWAGAVPLILAEAHFALSLYLPQTNRLDYWKDPRVWPDIRAAFEKFYALNPDTRVGRQNFAWYAYQCEQWDELNKQLPLLGEVEYEFFGGLAEFEKMTRLAKEHAKLPAQ